MKKLSQRKYILYRLLLIITLSVTVGAFVSVGNYIIPLVSFCVVMLAMWRLKKNTAIQFTDERVEKIGGIAARYTLSILLLFLVFIGIPLIALGKNSPTFYFVGNLVNFIAMGSLLCYAFIFHFLNKKGE